MLAGSLLIYHNYCCAQVLFSFRVKYPSSLLLPVPAIPTHSGVFPDKNARWEKVKEIINDLSLQMHSYITL